MRGRLSSLSNEAIAQQPRPWNLDLHRVPLPRCEWAAPLLLADGV